MNTFVMISTAASQEYTPHALRSFFHNTSFADGDSFYLIDNDHSLEPDSFAEWDLVQIIHNPQPLSFAENANKALELASQKKTDLFLLNNDIIFCEKWLEPLLVDLPVIMSSISNQHIQYSFGDLSLRPVMDLGDYINHEEELVWIGKAHHQKQRGFRQVLSTPFYCVKIPYLLYAEVGAFDTVFGPGGAEDDDYCLRSYLHGFGVFLALDSFLLHFQGKSTWRGPESKEDTDSRNKKYMGAFLKKWGLRLQRLILFRDESVINKEEEVFLKQNRVAGFLRSVAAHEGRNDRLPLLKGRMAAVVCVYDDNRWLKAAVESAYNHLDAFYFLVGKSPWNGEQGSNKQTLQLLAELADPDAKFRIVEGIWASETEQRNAGLGLLRENGFEYCFVLDADEVYEESELAALCEYISEKRYVHAWRIGMFTYWKSVDYRIVPPEPYQPVLILKVWAAEFTDKREIRAVHSESIPPEICMMHHLSYARSDEEVQRKITTFSHVDQMVPGWYETVWKAWEANPVMKNLHPCWPESYQSAQKVEEKDLPRVLRSYLRK